MRIAVAQLNPVVGALDGNIASIERAHARARDQGADLVVTPELAIVGYPPRDLLDRPAFVADAVAALRALCGRIQGPALLVGALVGSGDDPFALENGVANAALLIRDGQLVACHRKLLLPTYDVFDEARYFASGKRAVVAEHAATRIGLSVCEDIWNHAGYLPRPPYGRDPIQELAEAGAELVVNISASPFERHKGYSREQMLGEVARNTALPLLYVNQVGGNDSLIFDGRSLGISADGTVGARLPAFCEADELLTLKGGRLSGNLAASPPAPDEPAEEEVAEALTLGLRDYMAKCGFQGAVVGLSGGIDSALTCALAVRALGAENVIGVTMPSRYSSEGSVADALELGRRLRIRVDQLPIEPIFNAFLTGLTPSFNGAPGGLTAENLQARIRGTLLMAYANQLPRTLLLTTGNKSEAAVGYATLYGDMAGGLAVISDLYKTEVYALSRWLNRQKPAPIPEASITKEPSAELRPDQRDSDSLPPYEQLDPILRGFVDQALGVEALAAAGYDRELARKVAGMVMRSEYKRRQMAPGLRVSRKAFGEGRRLPIAQGYRFES